MCAPDVFRWRPRRPRMQKPAETTSFVESIAGLRERLAPWRRTGSIGLVPTMGALHAGHARVAEHARPEGQFVVVSIFLNPLEFDRREDLERYPRTLQSRLRFRGTPGGGVAVRPS